VPNQMLVRSLSCLGVVAALCVLPGFREARAVVATPPGTSVDEDADRIEKKIRQLLDVTGASDLGKQTMEQMMAQFEQMPALPEGFAEKFLELADPDQLVEMVIPIYAKHLDEDSLDGAIAFAQSEAGRKFYEVQPMIVEESMQVGMEWGQELAKEVMAELGY
jgi:hypothetical protein